MMNFLKEHLLATIGVLQEEPPDVSTGNLSAAVTALSHVWYYGEQLPH
ncbi:hypothetical protein ACVWYG_002702 [Pedobacter sp. UYEF25]